MARSLPSGNAGSSKGWHASVNINQRLLLTPAGAANRYGIQTGKIWSAFGSGQLGLVVLGPKAVRNSGSDALAGSLVAAAPLILLDLHHLPP